jgi:hypothetical protein
MLLLVQALLPRQLKGVSAHRTLTAPAKTPASLGIVLWTHASSQSVIMAKCVRATTAVVAMLCAKHQLYWALLLDRAVMEGRQCSAWWTHAAPGSAVMA